MGKAIFMGSIFDSKERVDPSVSITTGANLRKIPGQDSETVEEKNLSTATFDREKAAERGWNNRFCEKCGRPYTRPPPWSSYPNAKDHPDWAEWILTVYCRRGLCNGVQPQGECKPRSVKSTQTKSKK